MFHCSMEEVCSLKYFVILGLLIETCAAGMSPISSEGDGGGGLRGYSTESPELVEVFNPQILIKNVKLETKIKVRYGRTRIAISLHNPHTKSLQSSFRIVLPQDAFFTVFKLRRGNNPKLYSATIMRKENARELFRLFSNFETNGTISAGFIELSNEMDFNCASYNLKFTLGPGVQIQAYLLYERQIERKKELYSDKIHIYPMENVVIQLFEIIVDIEEFEQIKKLQCSPETEGAYNCSRTAKTEISSHDSKAGLTWRNVNVNINFSSSYPFEFQYELDQQNTTSALVMIQSNGNLYFLHLFVPQDLPPIRKHIVFLLDISDSMHGEKLDQLKWSMTEIFDDLSEDDFFSIIPFSNDVTIWTPFQGERRKCPLPIPVKPKYTEKALYFIRNLQVHGSTNIEIGMLKAFDVIQLFSPDSTDTCDQAGNINTPASIRSKLSLKLPENVESMIFFLSDGVPTSGIIDMKYLLNLFTNFNMNLTTPIQLHSIAYGESADVGFLNALSTRNGGIMKRIVKNSGAGIELTNFYTEISSQVVTKIQTFASIKMKNNDENETSASEAPMIVQEQILSKLVLVKGAEVLTAGLLFPSANQTKLMQQPSSNFHWSTTASGRFGQVNFTSNLYDCRSLKTTFAECLERIDFYLLRLQAYQLLKKLLDRDRFVQQGYICPKPCNTADFSCADEFLNYDANEDDGTEECANPYKEKAIDLALKEGFITPYTAFILSTEPEIDIGITGNVTLRNEKVRWGKQQKVSESEASSPAEEIQEHFGTHPQKLINEKSSMNIMNTTKEDQELPWLTKLLQNFSNRMGSNTTRSVNETSIK